MIHPSLSSLVLAALCACTEAAPTTTPSSTTTPTSAAQPADPSPEASEPTAAEPATTEPAAAAPSLPKPGPEDPPIPADTEIQTTESGIRYSVLKKGTGTVHPTAADTVEVHYTGWLLNGKMFDSSKKGGKPVTFPLNGVIKGWTEGVQLMTEGDVFKFTIPYALGYGESGGGPIPPKSDLIFEVELLRIIATPKFTPGNPEAQTTTASGLVYETLKEGKGRRPKPDEICVVQFAMFSEDGTLRQHSTGPNAKPIEASANDMARFPFMAEAFPLLELGSRKRFEVPGKLQVPPGSSPTREVPMMIAEFELVDIITPLPIPEFSLSADDKKVTTDSGLQYEIIKPGTGTTHPKLLKPVTVHYAGWLTDGTLFDSSFSRAKPSTFTLGRVIKGWNEGLQLMTEGAIYKFTIPGNLAYGKRGSPPKIGPDATLVFYVELIEIPE